MANLPRPETKEGKRGFTFPYMVYQPEIYSNLAWTNQGIWRDIVNQQPIAVLCRETIIEKISTIDWRIEPKDSTKRQELRTEIEYYERLFEQNNGLDWISFLEWVLGDALDLPFGAGVELVYKGDNPSKRLSDFVPLDGATLFPSNNRKFPVVQRVPDMDVTKPVIFPEHAINRLYYSPRREFKWRGWGMSPPEKIYLALKMLVKGDEYYWRLLIDTPEAGILDLIDMEKESAELWLESLRSLMSGQDPLKVPVLYEHNTPAKFIPFGRPPSEILYDSTTMKYAAITCAGYGLSLGDIGVRVSENGGNTLAGTIRDERNSNRKGVGFAKTKLRLFMNRMLPKSLEFMWVDPDEEQQVARGRAKLSSATAYNSLITNKIISPKEARQDYIASGLPSTTLPEDIPEEDMELFDDLGGQDQNPPERQNMLTATQPPSMGGQGEVRRAEVDDILEQSIFGFLNVTFTDETLSLPEEEYLELVSTTPVFSEKLLPTLLDLYDWQSDETLRSETIPSEAIVSGLEKTVKDVAGIMIEAKSLALDFEDDLSDNLDDLRINIGNQIVNSLVDNISNSRKG